MPKKKEPKSRAATLGASYRAASTGVILASPATLAVSTGVRDAKGIIAQYRVDVKPLAIGTTIHVLDDRLGQKLLGHNSALGRNSATAWASEVFPAVLPAAEEGLHGGAGYGTAEYTVRKTSYNPGVGTETGKLKEYLMWKYGLGVVRKLSSVSSLSRVFDPVKKILGSFGGSL